MSVTAEQKLEAEYEKILLRYPYSSTPKSTNVLVFILCFPKRLQPKDFLYVYLIFDTIQFTLFMQGAAGTLLLNIVPNYYVSIPMSVSTIVPSFGVLIFLFCINKNWERWFNHPRGPAYLKKRLALFVIVRGLFQSKFLFINGVNMTRMFWIWTSYWFRDDGHHFQEIQSGMGFIISLLFVFLLGYLIYVGKLLLDVQEKLQLLKVAKKKKVTVSLPRVRREES